MLCMTGTEDGSPIDPNLSPAMRLEVYGALPAGNKFQLVFDGAEHSAFGDSGGLKARKRDPNHHPAIQKISGHFWDAYLKSSVESKAWLQSDSPREACDLNERDTWEWK